MNEGGRERETEAGRHKGRERGEEEEPVCRVFVTVHNPSCKADVKGEGWGGRGARS